MIARIRRALNINGVKDLEPLTLQLDGLSFAALPS